MNNNVKEKWPALWAGLDQIPTRDLKRLLGELRDKKTPLLFDGTIETDEGAY